MDIVVLMVEKDSPAQKVVNEISVVEGKSWSGKTKDGRDCKVNRYDDQAFYGMINIKGEPNWTAAVWDHNGRCIGTTTFHGADLDI